MLLRLSLELLVESNEFGVGQHVGAVGPVKKQKKKRKRERGRGLAVLLLSLCPHACSKFTADSLFISSSVASFFGDTTTPLFGAILRESGDMGDGWSEGEGYGVWGFVGIL